MQNKKDASARIYLCAQTVLITSAVSDTAEATYDHIAIPRIHAVDDASLDIAKSLEKALAGYRRIPTRFDAMPGFAEENECAFEHLKFTYHPLERTAIYRELRFVEVVRNDGILTFTPRVGNGEGWFKPLPRFVVSIPPADAQNHDAVTKALRKALGLAQVDADVYAGTKLPKVPTIEPSASRLVDTVMPLASKEDRDDAARHWFGFLEVLTDIPDKVERRRRDGAGDQSED